MDIEIVNEGAYGSALIHLGPGEAFVSEAGAMFRQSANVDRDVTTKPKGKSGGFFGGLKRLLGGDSFFMTTYQADSQGGEVGLAPTLPGDCYHVHLDGSVEWICQGASYLGSSPELSLDTEFQGLKKGLFSGESMFIMKVSGEGELIVEAFGRIQMIDVDGGIVVDSGHVVAYESTLDYDISKAGGSWLQSFFAGEGVVMKFRGRGKLLVQSHNRSEFGSSLGPMLPPR